MIFFYADSLKVFSSFFFLVCQLVVGWLVGLNSHDFDALKIVLKTWNRWTHWHVHKLTRKVSAPKKDNSEAELECGVNLQFVFFIIIFFFWFNGRTILWLRFHVHFQMFCVVFYESSLCCWYCFLDSIILRIW